MGFLKFLLFRLRLNFCALIFVCLKQSLSYMLWIKKTFNDDFFEGRKWICYIIKDYSKSCCVVCMCSGDIYHIKLKSSVQKHESIF